MFIAMNRFKTARGREQDFYLGHPHLELFERVVG